MEYFEKYIYRERSDHQKEMKAPDCLQSQIRGPQPEKERSAWDLHSQWLRRPAVSCYASVFFSPTAEDFVVQQKMHQDGFEKCDFL